MSYATIVDVQRLDPVRVFTATTSVVTTDDVIGFLGDAEAELDGALAALEYAVPVPTTASQSFRLVQRWNAMGAHALAEAAWPDSDLAESAMAAWQDVLKRLAKGQVKLPDLGKDSNAVKLRSRAPATPMFTRDMTL